MSTQTGLELAALILIVGTVGLAVMAKALYKHGRHGAGRR
jgi:hypothetical protein